MTELCPDGDRRPVSAHPPAASDIPRWPTTTAILNADGSGRLRINDKAEDLAAANLDSARAIVLQRVTATAIEVGRPVRLTSTDPDGEWELAVHPDGHVQELAARPARPTRRAAAPRATPPAQPIHDRPTRSSATRVGAGLALLAAILTTAVVVTSTSEQRAPTPAPTPTITRSVISDRAIVALTAHASTARRAALAENRRAQATQRRAAHRRAIAARARRRAAARRLNARAAARARARTAAPAPPARVAPATPPPPAPDAPAPPPPPPPTCGEFDLC